MLQSAEQPQQAIQNRHRVRRAAGDEEIDRNNRSTTVVDFGVVEERPAADRAGSDGDDQLRRRDRRVRVEQHRAHVLADRAGDDDAIRMTRRGDELNAEAAEIENDRTQDIQIRFTSIAATGTDLAELQRAAKQAPRLLVKSLRSFKLLAGQHQVLSRTRREPIFRGVANRLFRAGVRAISAEQTTAEVQSQSLVVDANRVGRTGFGASSAIGRALRRDQIQPTGPGTALCAVELDGRRVFVVERLSRTIGPQQLPLIDVSQGKRLTLIVDYSELGDSQDHVNWCDAVLLRTP